MTSLLLLLMLVVLAILSLKFCFPRAWGRLLRSQAGVFVVNAAGSNETTISGILAFVCLILGQVRFLFDADPLTNPEWGTLASGVMLMIGLWRAKDANKTGLTREVNAANTAEGK